MALVMGAFIGIAPLNEEKRWLNDFCEYQNEYKNTSYSEGGFAGIGSDPSISIYCENTEGEWIQYQFNDPHVENLDKDSLTEGENQ